MPTLHLLCGLPCTGKTTLGERLEREERALRLSPDVWMARIVGDGYDFVRRDAIQTVQLQIARRVLELGVSVVLEAGFWKRAERDEARALAAAVGARAKLHFLDAPLSELKRRVRMRNAALPPDTFVVDPDDLDLWATWLERPG
jgi:predicted kinase